MPDENITPPTPALKYDRADNFIATYANNAFFEASAWDLKIIFGQLDQSSGSIVVKQNVSVTIPWAQAKLALFWLRMQVEAMEVSTGKILLRKDLLPPELPPLTAEQENDPAAKQFHESYMKAREEFIAKN